MKGRIFFILCLLLIGGCDRERPISPNILSGSERFKRTDDSRFSPGKSYRQLTGKSVHADQKKQERKSKRSIKKADQTKKTLSGVIRRQTDTVLISRMDYIRSHGLEPDMNEPLNRDFLSRPSINGKFPSMITLSRESFVKINFDNDILDYTDRFYTNGIRIDIIAPGLQMNPLRFLMIPYWSSGTNYYGISLVQTMFTPSTTKTGGILYGDRPYAGCLYVGTSKITNDPVHHYRQSSELDAGIIGPNSYGEWVQRSFHNAVPTNNEPLGWEYQVQNDLILNYTAAVEKGILNRRSIEILLSASGNAGTLYTNLMGGGQIRAGWMNPYFSNLGVAKKQMLQDNDLRRFQFFFFLKASGKLVGYDATLQGGVFNGSSPYTLPSSSISRLVLQGSAGISFSVNGIRMDVEQFMLSPEFEQGWWHKWVHVALIFSL